MVNISSKKAYRTKRKAREAIKGCDMEQYERLWDYVAMIRQSNPHSHIAIQINRRSIKERATFQRLFYGLGALKRGFLAGCRPIIGLNDCFLKEPFGGQLLAALGRDGNDNMFPIAIAIAKGLVHAIDERFPGAEQRFCLKHLFENFKAKFKDSELSELFWATASATNVDDFKRALNALEIAQPQNEENLTVAGWLPYHLWSRAHYGMAAKIDISVNNLNESFNNYILKARDEPIVTLLEFFRRKLMQRLILKRQGIEKYGGKLCPNIVERLAKSVEKSRHCIAVFDGIESFEVDGFNRTSVVNLHRRSCLCGAFQLTGIPCVHAISAIQSMRMKVKNYVDECYSKEAYLRAYAYSIRIVPSKEHWIDSGMQLLNPPFAPASNTQGGATTASTSAPTREAPVHQASQQSSTAAITDNNPSSRSKRFKKN
ncbi:uncharacterized protein LOC113756608 [Coffea eugenioides]|uniref:uncharacterized protein LOC113756608 n=1 Tax=Coffea eugenioides TaxID=49369 RepID=UPI000F60AF7F|nr:uncharacterized protein LOC113756608 [Coffea eugenioides]